MNLKKLFSVLFAVILILAISQNSFAYSGIADTRETAISINDIGAYSSSLDYNDVDWFKYSNTSGLREVLNLHLYSYSLGQPANFDMYVYYTESNGSEVVLNPYEIGPNEDFAAVVVRPGTTVYIKVVGHTVYDFGDIKSYTLTKNITY